MSSKSYTNKGAFSVQANRIKQKRRLLNLSQKKVSTISSFSITTISRIENGTCPTEGYYRALESVLDHYLKTYKGELLKYHKEKADFHLEMVKILEEI